MGSNTGIGTFVAGDAGPDDLHDHVHVLDQELGSAVAASPVDILMAA